MSSLPRPALAPPGHGDTLTLRPPHSARRRPNSLCAFALNLAVFLLVGKTSTLTMNVVGIIKDWLLIAFSWSVIRDTITVINLAGYGIAFLGVAYYNHVKLQALKTKEAQKKSAQQPDDEETRLLEGKMEGGAGEMELGKKIDDCA